MDWIKVMIVGLAALLGLADPDKAGEICAACAAGYVLLPRLRDRLARPMVAEERRLRREAAEMVRRNEALEKQLKQLKEGR